MRSQTDPLRHVAFRPHFSMGLAFSKIGKDLVRLPSGRSPREAQVGHFQVGPLHDFLEKSPFFRLVMDGAPFEHLTLTSSVR